MAEGKSKYYRRWLNPPSSNYTGYIQYGVNKEINWVSIEFKVADCSRIVNLDFDDTETKKGRKAAIKKLKIIRDSAQHVIEMVEVIDECS